MAANIESFREWVPIRIYTRDSEPFVDWCYAGSARFTEPFFNDTIQRILRRPFSVLFRHQTQLDFLRELETECPGLDPTGFIFHMSRCGSTLVAQMLAAVTKNIVISEAPPIDSIVRYRGATADSRRDALKWMVGALGQPRSGCEKYYFIKFDSWNILDLDVIRSAFPNVPWIFLYRDPVEVIVSQMRQRGSHMVPGAIKHSLPDLGLEAALQMSPEEYCARILGRICESAAAPAMDPNSLLVNYDQLPDAVGDLILPHFNVSFDADQIRQMYEAAQFNAKTPQLFFEPDRESKRSEASDTVRQNAEKWVVPIYERLEELRRDRLVKL